MSTTIVGEIESTFVAMTSMGDRVRAERTAKGWSYQDLAERVTKAAGVKCPRVTIEKIEDRSSTASKWSLSIAAALGVDHNWLLTGKGPKVTPPSIDKKLRLLPPDIAEQLQDQFETLIDHEVEKRRIREPQ